MLATLGPIVGQASGRLGAIVASHNKGGPYFRNGTIPTVSTTDYALSAKARMADASTAWQALTAGQRAAWGQWALENPFTNRLGKQITLPGIAAHNSNFCRIRAHNKAPLTDPPIDPAPLPFYVITVTADIGPGGCEIAHFRSPIGADEWISIRACVSNSPAVNYVENKLRFIGKSGAAAASPFDYKTLIEARFGALVVGQTVTLYVSVFSDDTGLISPPLRGDAVVIDTT